MLPLPESLHRIIADWPVPAQAHFHTIRGIIHAVSQDLADVSLDETLKWGEPAWLPTKPRIGSTLRVAWKPARADDIGLYLNCNSTLVETMRGLYPKDFIFDGNRALYVALDQPLPQQAIAHCATLTLSYHRKTA